VQRGDDGLAFVADDVRGVVIVLPVRLHNVEDHGLYLLAGVTPDVRKVFHRIHDHALRFSWLSSMKRRLAAA
jgi:hypothetical protein